jgi:3'-phosphoadenosine 5'-phosphosulfate sulfotransferase (PAPS reductase)/FAD synthetase
MNNPYYISEPAAISFSGGRTSAYMLWRVLQAHGRTLPEHIKVVFANTGKEVNQTLDFVQACSDNWKVDIVWLEYDGKKKYKVVSHDTASREGEPFAKLIEDKKYLPNMIARFCTSELKVVPINRYLADIGMEDPASVIGIRADEPQRVAKQRGKDGYILPLADDGIAKADIHKFWLTQNFNLDLPMVKGVTDWGNCDLCFLKGSSIKLSIINAQPERADWWADQEAKIGARFRSDQPSYDQMRVFASDQGSLFEDKSIPCFCGD